ncbi:MAG: Fic family protein [Acidobacteriia bacterium]|nr:Fic family protein [Terriglobia bacterium]
MEFCEGAPPTIRFRPLSVAETPEAVKELCLSYRAVLNQQEVQPLVAVAALVFDFLCIHPFRDGNGRISRLLTLLGLFTGTGSRSDVLSTWSDWSRSPTMIIMRPFAKAPKAGMKDSTI